MAHKHRFLVFADDDFPALPVITADDIDVGDFVKWDGVDFSIKRLLAAGDVAAGYLGVAMQGSPFKVYSEAGDQRGLVVRRQGIFRFKTTAAEVYQPFQNVTVGADAQTVVKAGATAANRVGVVLLRPPFLARDDTATPVPEAITGAAGVEVPILIEPKFPTLRS